MYVCNPYRLSVFCLSVSCPFGKCAHCMSIHCTTFPYIYLLTVCSMYGWSIFCPNIQSAHHPNIRYMYGRYIKFPSICTHIIPISPPSIPIPLPGTFSLTYVLSFTYELMSSSCYRYPMQRCHILRPGLGRILVLPGSSIMYASSR